LLVEARERQGMSMPRVVVALAGFVFGHWLAVHKRGALPMLTGILPESMPPLPPNKMIPLDTGHLPLFRLILPRPHFSWRGQRLGWPRATRG
jgi:hypothetical protein